MATPRGRERHGGIPQSDDLPPISLSQKENWQKSAILGKFWILPPPRTSRPPPKKKRRENCAATAHQHTNFVQKAPNIAKIG